MCCNVLHHRGSETRQRCTIDHDCAISRATTKGRHTFYDGVFHGTAAAAQRDQENPRALQQQQSVRVSPFPLISRIRLKEFTFPVCQIMFLSAPIVSSVSAGWPARPFGHVIISRRYYPQFKIAACSNSIGSGDWPIIIVCFCAMEPHAGRSRVIRRVRAAARRYAGNK
jgi:hypothetical protein